MRISGWSSVVCSSDLLRDIIGRAAAPAHQRRRCEHANLVLFVEQPPHQRFERHASIGKFIDPHRLRQRDDMLPFGMVEPGMKPLAPFLALGQRSEEHTSELQSLMRSSYAVFCL